MRPILSLPWRKDGPPQEFVDRRRAARMDVVDDLPEDWRQLVHDYGLSVTIAIRDSGVAKVKNARHIIETVLNELSPTRGPSSSQGRRRDKGLVLIPKEPTESMIAASIETIAGGGIAITKHEKHRLRLRAAIAVAIGAKHVIVK